MVPNEPKGDIRMVFVLVEGDEAGQVCDGLGSDVGEVVAFQGLEDIFRLGRTLGLLWTLIRELEGEEWAFIAHSVSGKATVGTHSCFVALTVSLWFWSWK
jgi:hypothetical protein